MKLKKFKKTLFSKQQVVWDSVNFKGIDGVVVKVFNKKGIKYQVMFGDKIAYYDKKGRLYKKSAEPTLSKEPCLESGPIKSTSSDSHYEFTGEEKDGLHRIRATRDLPSHNVKKGDIGGFIEKESNLRGNAWVADNARVRGNAHVTGESLVSGNATVGGNSRIINSAIVTGDAKVYDDSIISGNAIVSGYARIEGYSNLMNNVIVTDNAIIEDSFLIRNVKVSGNAEIRDDSHLYDDSEVSGNSKISNTSIHDKCKVAGNANIKYSSLGGNSIIEGDAYLRNTYVRGESIIKGNVKLISNEHIKEDALIESDDDILHLEGLSRKIERITVYKRENGGLYFNCGEFHGRFEKMKEVFSDNGVEPVDSFLIHLLISRRFDLF